MELTFFSFVTLDDATAEDHRAYNVWHQLDHRPENLSLPGVAWGDRWGRPAEYKAAGRASEVDPHHSATDYIATYSFRRPVDDALAAWDQLGEDSFQWGRGPLIPGVRRTLLAFFHPVKGYAAGSTLVSPEVLPYRPSRGLHVTLTRYTEPHGASAHEHHRFEDRSLLPELVGLDGVAGAWTFSFAHHQQHRTLPFPTGTEDESGSLRIRLVYLDGEPLEVAARLDAYEATLRSSVALDPGAREVLLATPLRTIVPWVDW